MLVGLPRVDKGTPMIETPLSSGSRCFAMLCLTGVCNDAAHMAVRVIGRVRREREERMSGRKASNGMRRVTQRVGGASEVLHSCALYVQVMWSVHVKTRLRVCRSGAVKRCAEGCNVRGPSVVTPLISHFYASVPVALVRLFSDLSRGNSNAKATLSDTRGT